MLSRIASSCPPIFSIIVCEPQQRQIGNVAHLLFGYLSGLRSFSL